MHEIADSVDPRTPSSHAMSRTNAIFDSIFASRTPQPRETIGPCGMNGEARFPAIVTAG